MPSIHLWKDARVVEWNSLENCLTRKGKEGSNPSLSANKSHLQPSPKRAKTR
jgi:hypothetical protein